MELRVRAHLTHLYNLCILLLYIYYIFDYILVFSYSTAATIIPTIIWSLAIPVAALCHGHPVLSTMRTPTPPLKQNDRPSQKGEDAHPAPHWWHMDLNNMKPLDSWSLIHLSIMAWRRPWPPCCWSRPSVDYIQQYACRARRSHDGEREEEIKLSHVMKESHDVISEIHTR